jgi:hypothetical protein
MFDWLPPGASALLVLLLLTAGGYLLLLPLLVKFSQSLRAVSGYEPPWREQLPPDVMAFMDRTVWEMQTAGFLPAALVREAGAVPDVMLYLVLFTNPATQDRAAAAFSIGSNELTTIRTPTVTFETKFDSGFAVETGNFADAGVFPRDPNRNRMHIPKLKNVVVLYEVHRRRRAKHGPRGGRAVLPAPGRELDEQRAEEAADKERVRAAGYYWLDAAAGKYRPTWKGAYLMTWKLLFPIGWLRRRAKRVRARRELSELWLDPGLLDAPPPMAVPLVPVPAGVPGPATGSIPPPMP